MSLYTVTFDEGRIGRTGHHQPKTLRADGLDFLAEEIAAIANPLLITRRAEVSIDPRTATGAVRIDAWTAARFTFEEIPTYRSDTLGHDVTIPED